MIFKKLFIYKELISYFLHHVMLFFWSTTIGAVDHFLSIYNSLLYFFGPLLERQWPKKISIYISYLSIKNAILGQGRYYFF